MPRTLRRRARSFGRRLAGWPRRLAAVSCLVAAALSALTTPATGRAGASARTRSPVPGVRAMPIQLDASLAAMLSRDQRIDVLATLPDVGGGAAAEPVVVARGVRVLSVRAPTNGMSTDAAVVVVAVDRDQALRLARYAGSVLLVEIARYSGR